MPSTAGEILVDIRDTLRGTGSFASVTLGGDKDAARWPRAEIMLVSMNQMPPDDRADGRWSALKAKVYIHVRSAEEGLALEAPWTLSKLPRRTSGRSFSWPAPPGSAYRQRNRTGPGQSRTAPQASLSGLDL